MSLSLVSGTLDSYGQPIMRLVTTNRTVCDFYRDPFDGRVTWHTWNHRGIGGENAVSDSLFRAVEIALICLLRQLFIKRLTAAETLAALLNAQERDRAFWAAKEKRPAT